MLKIPSFAVLVLAMAAAAPALASDDEGARCGDAPREQRLSKEAIKAKGVELGYEVRRVKEDDGCYELHGFDKNGAKVELTLNPVSGEPVSRKDEDYRKDED